MSFPEAVCIDDGSPSWGSREKKEIPMMSGSWITNRMVENRLIIKYFIAIHLNKIKSTICYLCVITAFLCNFASPINITQFIIKKWANDESVTPPLNNLPPVYYRLKKYRRSLSGKSPQLNQLLLIRFFVTITRFCGSELKNQI